MSQGKLDMLQSESHRLYGLQHRLISMLPGILGIIAFGSGYYFHGDSEVIPSILGSVILAIVGYMSPVILTEGLNKPIPSNAHLELGSKSVRKALFILGFALLFGPGIVRLAGRVLGAA